jgi:hypothetical protein
MCGRSKFVRGALGLGRPELAALRLAPRLLINSAD